MYEPAGYHENFRYVWYSGFRAVICGLSFNIYGFEGDFYKIGLPNGKYALAHRKLAEAVTT